MTPGTASCSSAATATPASCPLPLPLHHPRRPGRPRGGSLHKVADRMGHPCREVPDRTRPRPGDLLELLDALEPDQPDRRRSPGRRPRPNPVSPLIARNRPDPSHQARTVCPSARRRPPHAPPRPGAHPALVTLAPPPPAPRDDLPPPLERDHRSRHHMSTNDRPSRSTAAVTASAGFNKRPLLEEYVPGKQ